jgi:hypothetical protein
MKPELVPPTDFGIIGFPCVKFSTNKNGHDAAVDIDDPTTLALVKQLIAFLRAYAWKKLVAIECVAGFFRSRAWDMIVEGMRGTDWQQLALLRADSEAMGLPQIRDRRIVVLSTQAPPARDLRGCFNKLARMEGRDPTSLADCILDAEQMRACFVSRGMLLEVCTPPPDPIAKCHLRQQIVGHSRAAHRRPALSCAKARLLRCALPVPLSARPVLVCACSTGSALTMRHANAWRSSAKRKLSKIKQKQLLHPPIPLSTFRTATLGSGSTSPRRRL